MAFTEGDLQFTKALKLLTKEELFIFGQIVGIEEYILTEINGYIPQNQTKSEAIQEILPIQILSEMWTAIAKELDVEVRDFVEISLLIL